VGRSARVTRSAAPAAIRRAEAGDAPLLVRLHAGSFDEPWSRDAFDRALAQPSGFGFVAGLEADPVGFALARVAADECEVLTLAVTPSQRRHGVGAALLAATLDHAQGLGARHVFLEVAADNLPAQAMYGAAGFRRVGVREGYFRRGARAIDAWTLERGLAG